MSERPHVFFKLYGTNINEPTYRRRGLWVVDQLRRLGWRVRTDSADGCRIAILQRVANAEEVRQHKSAGRIVIFEQNDNLLCNGTPFYRQTEEETVREADFVAVSCRWLQRIYGRVNPSCLIVPEMLEPEFWQTPRPALPERPLVLSWHGLNDNLQYLEWLIYQLGPIRDLRLKIIMPPKDSKGRSNADRVARWPIPTEFMEWRLESFVREIASAHGGFVILPDTHFARGKAHHKVVGYQALGMPVVASNVSGYREVVRHGETGLLAETPEEWRECIESLRDPKLRERIGKAAVAMSLHFTPEAVGRQWDRAVTKCWEARAR